MEETTPSSLLESTTSAATSVQKHVLGLGVACVDIIACVSVYPEPDEKIRAESVQLFSGGNVGNTLTAISKLGAVSTSLITKIGKDSNGEHVLNDLRSVGVDVKNVIISKTSPTLLVYVIVDKQARRTCIASPNEGELTPSEVTAKLGFKAVGDGTQNCNDLLSGVQLVHLDSRHTEAAVTLATEANRRDILVSMDVEKHRPFLPELIPLCDMFFTNQEFPESYFSSRMNDSFSVRLQNKSEKSSTNERDDKGFMRALLAMTFLFDEAPSDGRSAPGRSRAQLVVTTRGALGSLLMRRKAETISDESPVKKRKCESGIDDTFVCPDVVQRTPLEVREYVLVRHCTASRAEEFYHIVRCAAWPVKPEDVVDTTGAGDAYIGGFISGWSKGFDDIKCMKLGTAVASAKLSKKGAREGLPSLLELKTRLETLINHKAETKE